MTTVTDGVVKPRNSHIFERQVDDRYVDPEWCSRRLFAVERFAGLIWDPCCGLGNILKAARAAHYSSYGSDISEDAIGTVQDFLTATALVNKFSIVCNPPFKLIEEFAKHALQLGALKVAMIFQAARLNAAHKWLEPLPLRRTWFLTPRPSMPPAEFILHGGEPKNGRSDFVWLVFEPNYEGEPMMGWLHREAV